MKKKMIGVLLGIIVLGSHVGIAQEQTVIEKQNEGTFFAGSGFRYSFKKYPPKKYNGRTRYRVEKTKSGYDGYYR
ncbi:hypothetical protein IGI37_000331 [Enterococcus sp. AZ194]|uniref:hypothetical protein n=1 Tax=Enterococcus sp. AZ194 TaxID=2774629 RepID=UPI003F26FE1D